MAPFMTLIFFLLMAMIGFVFDLYLFSQGAFGNRYVKRTKFTCPQSTGSRVKNQDEYGYYACSDTMYDKSHHIVHTVLVVMFAAMVIVGMLIFMFINAFA